MHFPDALEESSRELLGFHPAFLKLNLSRGPHVWGCNNRWRNIGADVVFSALAVHFCEKYTIEIKIWPNFIWHLAILEGSDSSPQVFLSRQSHGIMDLVIFKKLLGHL